MKPRASVHFLFRIILAATLGAGVVAVPVVEASAATSSPVKEIIANGYASVNTIRGYFFCSSAACKKDKSAEGKKATLAMNYLEGEAVALQPSRAPSAQRPILKKFVADVKSLAKVYAAYSSQTTSNEVTRNTGILYYESANVGSDIYLMTSVVAGSKILFADWGVGAVAVLYTMQIETQVVSAKTSGVATVIAASLDLEQDAAALIKDANGPNQQFNDLLVTFAKTQTAVCKAENDILEKKKSSLTSAILKADIASLSSQFTKIVDLEKSLAK
ncbi:MAG: hypothetical protein ABR963_04545 [Acidimicrobiales bacterium]